MKSSYSIIYLSLKPAVQEQIAIGLLLTNGEMAFFDYSVLKLRYVSKLMPDKTLAFVNNYLAGLRGGFKELKLYSQDYLNYLNNYRNNLIKFSKIAEINLETNEINFRKLFEKFVFTEAHHKSELIPEKLNINTKIKNILYPRIKDHVNIDKTFTPKDIPSLLIPTVKINFIGRNDNPVAGEVIDFDGTLNSISNKISHFISLIKAFEIERKEGKFFVIGDEPSKPAPSYDTWKHLKESKLVEMVSTNEVERVSNYILTHNVKPFQN